MRLQHRGLGGGACAQGFDAPAQHGVHQVRRSQEGGIDLAGCLGCGIVPGRVEILDQRSEAQSVVLDRPCCRYAVVELVDAPHHACVEGRGNRRGRGFAARGQQCGDRALAVHLPDQPGGGEWRAVRARGRTALVVVEAPGGGVMDAPDIPGDIGGLDRCRNAGAQQHMVAPRRLQAECEAQDRIGEDLVAMELAAMGGKGRAWRAGHAQDPPV